MDRAHELAGELVVALARDRRRAGGDALQDLAEGREEGIVLELGLVVDALQ
jgi:hypothetical protein